MLTKGLFSSKKEDWSTPQKLFDKLNSEFHFTLDPCATDENAKCKKYYTKEDDGLSKSWEGERVFCNPPYGREIGKWVKKCAWWLSNIAVMLIPARTDTAWFHDYIYNIKHYKDPKAFDIRFLRGRLKFSGYKNSAPFPSMIVIFKGKTD